jgi:peroxiredoxin Q/BCP
MLEPGQTIPDVSLLDADGTPVRLRDLLGERVLVVYFYPKDDTPGCTAQACGFRDAYEDFVEAGAEVVGISGDSQASHRAFAQKHRLPFRLLSDPDGEARRAFGVKKTLGLLPGRATFVVDRQGRILDAFSSQLRVGTHVQRALRHVREQAGNPS